MRCGGWLVANAASHSNRGIPAEMWFPRRGGVLSGGSLARGVENTDIDPAVTEGILQGSAGLFRGMRG